MFTLDKKKLTGNLFLLTTAIIWGSAFVAQRVGMDYIGPLTFSATRFLLAVLALIPIIHFMDKVNEKQNKENGSENEELSLEERKLKRKVMFVASITCGSVVFVAATLQQFGLVFTTAGKTGFITALYIILVPIFSVVLKHRPGLKCWIGVILGAIGLYFLCITESFTIAFGDFIVLIGAGFWATHILVIDHFVPRISDPVRLSMYQFVVCGILSFIGAIIFEDISIDAIIESAVPIIYAGVLSGGVGFTFQILGQKHTNPTVASLILSMEAVFGAIFGYLILNEIMTTREIIGCVLMFCAIVISQLPDKKRPECIQ